jgi:outer membrane cobalamin receptor
LLSSVAAVIAGIAASVVPAGAPPADSLSTVLEPTGPATYFASEVLVVADRPPRFAAVSAAAVEAAGTSVSRALGFAGHASSSDYGTSAFASVRGLPAEHVAVEYDGIPLNSMQNGTFDLALLDLLGTTAAVTRGPFAWLGASGASQGAVALAAREPDGVGFSALVGSGGGGLRTGVGDGRGGVSLSVLGQDWERDGASMAGWSCRARALTAAGEAAVTYLDATRGLPGAVDAPWSAGVLDDEIALARFRFRELGRTRATVYATRHEQHYEDSLSSPTHVVSSLGGVLAADVTRDGPVRSLVAASYDWSVLDSHDPMTADIGRRTRGSGSLVARASSGRSAVKAVAQCGLEHTTDFGTAVSGALGGSVSGGRGRAWASVGTAYRAPTINELHWPADAWTEGNPDLSPERLVTAEVGASVVAGPVTLGAVAYRTDASDLIVWAESDGVWRPENVGAALLEGIEADAAARLGPVSLSYAGDFATAEDDGTGLDLPYRPRAVHTVTAAAGAGGFRVEARARRAGEAYTDAANEQTLEAYTVADASVSFGLPMEGMSAVLEVTNLFDERYETRRGYEASGRRLLAALLITQSQKPW